MEMHKVLSLPLKAVSTPTLTWLSNDPFPILIQYRCGQSGSFIPLTTDTMDEIEKLDIPAELLLHMKRALEQECTWLIFDPNVVEEKEVRMIGVSTGHLELQNRERLDNEGYTDLIVEGKGEHGWFIRMDQPLLNKEDLGVTWDLLDVIEMALEQQVDWIMFDTDADIYEQLRFCDDDEEEVLR